MRVSLLYYINIFCYIILLLYYSIFTGLGMRMVILCAILVNGQYFDKKKALSLGIVGSGCGVGTLIIPYVLRPLFDHMDFTSAMLLYGRNS